MANSIFNVGDVEGKIDVLSEHVGTINTKLSNLFVTDTWTFTTDANGVYIDYTLLRSQWTIVCAIIIRDGSAYNSWAGFIPGATTDGFLSLKAIDNSVNPVKSLASTSFKAQVTLMKLT